MNKATVAILSTCGLAVCFGLFFFGSYNIDPKEALEQYSSISAGQQKPGRGELFDTSRQLRDAKDEANKPVSNPNVPVDLAAKILDPIAAVHYFNQAGAVDATYGDGAWEGSGDRYVGTTGRVMERVASSGCGPTSMAIIVYDQIDKNITPKDTVQYYCDSKLYTGNGSQWWSGVDAATHYGLKSEVEPFNNQNGHKNEEVAWLKSHLEKGHWIYALVKDGDPDGSKPVHIGTPSVWIGTGHFITFFGYDPSTDSSVCFDCGSQPLNRKWYTLETIWNETRVAYGMVAVWKE